MIEWKIQVFDNGRAYIRAYYKCMNGDCPSQKQYGNGLNYLETIHGVKSNSKFELVDERKKQKG